MQFLPDSPPYLVKSSRDSLNPKSDAFKAYVFFSGNVAAAEQEIQKVTNSKYKLTSNKIMWDYVCILWLKYKKNWFTAFISDDFAG